MNLQKFIAHAGICSRRKAENLIRARKVFVNGKAAEIGMQVTEHDKVEISGRPLVIGQQKIYIKLNKPAGYTCTNRKFPGEQNIFTLLKFPKSESVSWPKDDVSSAPARLYVAGRLDKNSRGLILLTNDGDLAQCISHPRFEHEKKYIVQVEKIKKAAENPEISLREAESILKEFKEGIDIGQGDGTARVKNIMFLGKNSFALMLTYGKKRQIRRMFARMGYEVTDLLRTKIANIELGNLKKGEWEYIKREQIKL